LAVVDLPIISTLFLAITICQYVIRTFTPSGISRAYYSLFHFAKQRLIGKGIAFPTTDVHKGVANELYRLDHNIGRKFKSFRDNRNTADYDLGSSYCNALNSKAIINDISKLIEKIDNISSPR